MLLRSILELSSRRAISRIPRKFTTTQIPNFLRKELSTKPKPNTSPPPESGSGGSGGSTSKVIIGSALVGGAILAAYKSGYVDQVLGGKEENQSKSLKEVEGIVEVTPDAKDDHKFEDQYVLPDRTEVDKAGSSVVDEKVENNETLSDRSQVEEKSEVTREEIDIPDEEKKNDFVDYSRSSSESDDRSSDSEKSPELETIGEEGDTDKRSDEEVQTSPVFTLSDEAVEESEVEVVAPRVHFSIEETKELQNAPGKDAKEPSSLLEEYNLEDPDGSSYTSSDKHSGNNQDILAEEEALSSALEDVGDAYISKDGKLILDFLQAIHAAESRQAELDARMYAAEKKTLKEKYEKELKDAAIRELMLAEEAAMLDKELKRERAKAAAALKSLQEQLEEKYKNELENKKRMAENKLKKVEELAKAEFTAKIASEKAAQIEKIAEANLHINALCMAFYARSEEARRSHSAHKLALGALALEDSLSKGLPIQTEIEALNSYLEGIDKESVLGLVLSSLPDETRNDGTDTLLQLNQKFDALKGTLRHFTLIPPGGGGILVHSLARIASWLKVKETDHSGDGIESLINRVESHLVNGKIAEAADALEEGVKGTEASEIVGDWVRRARNRAITEQALTLLQSYATSISVT